MRISENMDLYVLAENMGNVATLADAMVMRDLLIESGYATTSEIPTDEWLEMLENSARSGDGN